MAHDIGTVSNWLLRNTIVPADPEQILRGLGSGLIACGIPVARISLGRSMLHPNLGMMDLTWDARTDTVKTETASRKMISRNLHSQGPFRELMQVSASRFLVEREQAVAKILRSPAEELPRVSADLTDATARARYDLFERLASEGMTGYFAYSMPFSTSLHEVGDSSFAIGASASFACSRAGGFSRADETALVEIALPLMACLRVISESFLTRALLEAYVGRNAASEVLSGQIALGDMREIDCVLLYSDIRGSTALSQQLAPQDYLDLLNRYFDRVAGAVQDHGGEVMKFIGDGLLAIFPISPESRTAGCDAALAAARTALARSAQARDVALPPFGIALDAGKVYYGNVGTETRLDFTVIGATVARASRIEALTRDLGHPILASQAFSADCSDPGTALSARPLSGFQDPVGIFAYSC